MRRSIEEDFNSHPLYRSLSIKKVFAFVRSRVRRLGVFSEEEVEEFAFDVTSDALFEFFVTEKAGVQIDNKFKFIIDCAEKYLNRVEFKRLAATWKNSEDQTNLNYKKVDLQQLDDFRSANEIDITDLLDCLNSEEREVALLLNDGYLNKEIATRMNKSQATVSRTVKGIRTKIRRRLTDMSKDAY